MLEHLIQLVVLFVVIFDPMASFVVFIAATKSMTEADRRRTALLAILSAALISYAVLLFGQQLLVLFSINILYFKVAGGMILSILGVEMTLGYPLTNVDVTKESSVHGIAAIIATPLLTGPAAITAIIISVREYGFIDTGLAVTIVLVFSAVLFLLSTRINRVVGKAPIQILSTILGLITLAWGVKFIVEGLISLW